MSTSSTSRRRRTSLRARLHIRQCLHLVLLRAARADQRRPHDQRHLVDISPVLSAGPSASGDPVHVAREADRLSLHGATCTQSPRRYVSGQRRAIQRSGAVAGDAQRDLAPRHVDGARRQTPAFFSRYARAKSRAAPTSPSRTVTRAERFSLSLVRAISVSIAATRSSRAA